MRPYIHVGNERYHHPVSAAVFPSARGACHFHCEMLFDHCEIEESDANGLFMRSSLGFLFLPLISPGRDVRGRREQVFHDRDNSILVSLFDLVIATVLDHPRQPRDSVEEHIFQSPLGNFRDNLPYRKD
jgi:hypothetical protein